MEKEIKRRCDDFNEKVLNNIRNVMNVKEIKQSSIAIHLGMQEPQISKLLNGKTKLTLEHLAGFASALSVREIDLITYPEEYILKTEERQAPVKAILQIELQEDKKDQVLKFIFGENNVEILNK